MDVRVGLWRKLSTEELMLLNRGVGEDSWESLGLQGDPTSPFWRRSALGFLWKLKLQYLGHLMRRVDWLEKTMMLGGIGGRRRRGWEGWMASLTQWTWVWVNSRSWWWTGRPGVLWFVGSQGVGHDWATELNWTYLISNFIFNCLISCLCKSAAMKIDIDIWERYFEGNVSPTYSSRFFHVHKLTSPDYYKAIHLHHIILTSAKLPL